MNRPARCRPARCRPAPCALPPFPVWPAPGLPEVWAEVTPPAPPEPPLEDEPPLLAEPPVPAWFPPAACTAPPDCAVVPPPALLVAPPEAAFPPLTTSSLHAAMSNSATPTPARKDPRLTSPLFDITESPGRTSIERADVACARESTRRKRRSRQATNPAGFKVKGP